MCSRAFSDRSALAERLRSSPRMSNGTTFLMIALSLGACEREAERVDQARHEASEARAEVNAMKPAIKQVRDALGDSAEDSLYVQTVPKRGYRFLAPVEIGPEPVEPVIAGSVDPYLQKAIWANIVELRLADNRRRQHQTWLVIALGCLAIAVVALMLIR